MFIVLKVIMPYVTVIRPFFNCNMSFSCDQTLEDLNEKLQGQHKQLQERNQKDFFFKD